MEIEQTPGAEGTQGTPSAPENLNPERPAQVEGAGSAPEGQNGGGREFNVQNYIHANKRVTDNLRKDIGEIKELLSKLSQPAPIQTPSAPSSEPDIWTDPKSFIQREVKQTLTQDLKTELAQERTRNEKEKAEAYILSQDYIDPESEADRAELQKIFSERGFAHSWNNNPFAAAEGILEIFKARKGIGRQTPPRVQAGAVHGGSAPASNGNGKKFWTAREIKSMSLEDYNRHKDDIDSAVAEGRVEGLKTNP